MGKRSNFERRDRNFYPTPPGPVQMLIPHLVPGISFDEPCAGDGALIGHLSKAGFSCGNAYDIEPRAAGIRELDALKIRRAPKDCFITNPPWNSRSDLIACDIIRHLSMLAPTWLLLPADYMHNKYMLEFRDRLVRIVSVGRVKWIEGTDSTGKDNCAWYLFDKPLPGRRTEFCLGCFQGDSSCAG